MADFASVTGLCLNLNTGTAASGTSTTQAGAVWTRLNNNGTSGAMELRFSDGSANGAIGSAAWPLMTRPVATSAVSYQYAATADTTLLGYLGGSSNVPIAWSNANFNDARWTWDNLGTFASAPIFTAFLDTSHAAIVRSPNATNSGVANLLQGSTVDTGSPARSYLKGNAWGRVSSAGAPTVAPSNAPVVTSGATGSAVPTAGANWLGQYQGLMGLTDFITAPFTPTGATADSWQVMLHLFTGPNENVGTYAAITIAISYTFS